MSGGGEASATPLSVYLPFNRDCLRGAFVPAKEVKTPTAHRGRWFIIQDQGLIVAAEDHGFAVPCGDPPAGLGRVLDQPLLLGTYQGEPCWVASLPADTDLPRGLQCETLIPMKGTRLPDDLLSLGGMAMQALYWQGTSGYCPRCGAPTLSIEGEWGKRCPRCHYEHYPHLHPAVIILITDGDRCLLARKAGWAPGRYALVAGFVDNGESLEGAVHREVKEEVGVDVKNVQYVGSQNWPFPSQLMIGFIATYAGGEIRVDERELEDARWFRCTNLPAGPSRHSIARWIMDTYASRSPRPR